MIKFDPISIYNRILNKLQQDPNWKVVGNNSVVSAIIKSNAEAASEIARYAEYLFKESKWDTAQNTSSILSMANILGYRPKRKISATGTIYVSPDPRTHSVGKTISSSEFESGTSFKWTSPTSDLNITSDCTIVDSKNRQYIPLPKFFKKTERYVKLEIVQGVRKSVYIDIDTIRSTATNSKLDPYLYIPVAINDCENADSTSTKPFLRVKVLSNTSESLTPIEYRVVDTLLFSNATDYDVEVYNDIYNRSLFYLKFNNDPNRGKTLDISRSNSSIAGIEVEYIETLGSEGNVDHLFENFTITNVMDGNSNPIKLYGVNFDVISNGKDEETVSDIKRNAPQHYISNYSSGTKEAYIQNIKNMEFPIGEEMVRPKQVQVYGNKIVDSTGNTTPITCISFIASGLEDIVGKMADEDKNPYEKIEESLNYNLAKLKSPQDTLKFIPPNYVTYALGINCKVNRKYVADIHQLENNIRDFVDILYGSNSNFNDFGRNIYPTNIEAEIKNYFGDAVIAPTVELEAIKRINWGDSIRMTPRTTDDSGQSIEIKTIRAPFGFNPVFLGNLTPKGFKDFKVSAGYVMRIDIMYKKPRALAQSMNFHTSIFIEDDARLRDKPDTRAFYLRKDTQNSGTWVSDFSKGSSDYQYLKNASQLTSSQQFYFKDYLLTDNDYRNLLKKNNSAEATTIDSHKLSPGAIDDYLIYFSADYDDEGDTSNIGSGWIELTFDPIYDTLTKFSRYDANLRGALAKCPLSILKCGNDQGRAAFEEFQKILNNYVDIYVGMRPYDPQLVINSSSAKRNENTVLLIDSYDSLTTSVTTVNLTPFKRPRMISVKCEYEE